MSIKLDVTKECALLLDDHDKLKGFRDRFYLPAGKFIWMGIPGSPFKDAEGALLNALKDFRELGIDGWMDGILLVYPGGGDWKDTGCPCGGRGKRSNCPFFKHR